MVDSKRSHLIQLADLASFALNACVAPAASTARAQRWYEEHLAVIAAEGTNEFGYRRI